MRMLTLLALAVAAEQATVPAHTGGMSLLIECKDAEVKKPVTVDSAGCASYIIGSVDASRFYAALYAPDVPFRVFCAPEEVTYLQYITVVVEFLRKHPERLHESRQRLVQDALHAAFPCPK